MDWQEFLQVAQKVAQEEGYPLAVLAGQAAQETGRNVSSAPGWNFFGIKGPGQLLKTWEDYGNGPVSVMANFRTYNSPEDSIRDYINLIKNNYPQAWAQRDNPVAMVQAIKAGGYATDPNYVAAVTNTPEFKQYVNAPQPTQTPQPQATPTQPQKPKSFMDILKDYLNPQSYASDDITNPGGVQNFSYQGYQQQPNGTINYQVKPGDTMWGIADQYLGGGQNWNQIKGYSGSPTSLPVGQNLQISKPGVKSYTQPATHPGGYSPSNANTSTNNGPVYSAPPASKPAQNYSQPVSQPSGSLNFSPSKSSGQAANNAAVVNKATTTKSGLKLTI